MVSASGPVGGSASAPYNMALAWEAQKLNLNPQPRYRLAKPDVPLIGVILDKLRLGFYTPRSCDTFADGLPGLASTKLGRGRRRGSVTPKRCQAWTKGPKVEGGVYWQCDEQPGLPSGSSYAVCEFNPQKLTGEGWQDLRESLRLLGVADPGSLYVDRYDAAFDYRAQREHLLLDDRRRLLDMFGVSRKGPETERTGYRHGSLLRAQLYDKTRERRSKGEDCEAGVVRFELQVQKPSPVDAPAPLYGFRPSDALVLADLDRVMYPGGDITVRAFAYHPLRVADHVYGSLAAYARGLGIRAALGYAVDVFRLRSSQRDQWADTFVPQLASAPSVVFADRWPAAVESVRRRLVW